MWTPSYVPHENWSTTENSLRPLLSKHVKKNHKKQVANQEPSSSTSVPVTSPTKKHRLEKRLAGVYYIPLPIWLFQQWRHETVLLGMNKRIHSFSLPSSCSFNYNTNRLCIITSLFGLELGSTANFKNTLLAYFIND